jgi:peptidoglycan/xylan/chitin deacetylase (PgdA/CDA1 family)
MPVPHSTLTWPDGRKVAVLITAAVELWSEGRWPAYAPMADAWPLGGAHDSHSVSWSEYGASTGVWRLLDILGHWRMPATFGVNGLVAERFPDAVLAISEAGHEIAAHSYAQDVLPVLLDADAERANLIRTTEALSTVTGVRPSGWMSPRATGSVRTLELLSEFGYQWSGDFNDRELPYVVPTSRGPLVAIMQGDFSDVRASVTGPAGYRDAHRDLLSYLLQSPYPEVLNVNVHAHVGGRPSMASMFDQILESVYEAGDEVWIATRAQVAEHVLRQSIQEPLRPTR